MPLWPHQIEAVTAVHAAARDGLSRMTVVCACGTGKTLIAHRCAQLLAPQGTVLVVVPTQALVIQTAARWREAGRGGTAVAVFSLSQTESGLNPQDAVVSDDPHTIAGILNRPGPATVFATYASLHQLQLAHRLHGLPAWDLIVVDEAHRTCTASDQGWGTVHDDTALPAKTRLYMTATPRIWDTPAADLGDLMEAAPTATMDHQDIFGPTVFRLGLAQAIERGILADYQVLMPVVRDSDLRAILSDRAPHTSAHHNGLRAAAIQICVLRAIAEHDLRRVLVFHNRIDAAHAFAEQLRRTAAELPEPLGVPDLWSHAIDSDQSMFRRRILLHQFRQDTPRCAVLSNVRTLNEGIDVPAIDAVVFAAPRYSVIDAIQAIGRGLRQRPGQGKTAQLIFPLYLADGTVTPQALEQSAFGPLWTILQALRAYDDTFLDRIALPRPTGAARGLTRHPHYSQPERVTEISQALGLEITLPAVGTWHDGIRAATAYRDAFHHLDVPAGHRTHDGFPLGEWTTNQRLRRQWSKLPAEHQQALDHLGMLWQAPQNTFERMLTRAQGFVREHGHLVPPTTTTFGGHIIGQWLATCRTQQNKGQLAAAHAQALTALDPWWNPPWSLMWQRNYRQAQAHFHAGGTLWDLPPRRRITAHSHTSMQWMQTQRVQIDKLARAQVDLLIQIGVTPVARVVYPGGHETEESAAFLRGLQAAESFLAREGHLQVPPNHLEAERNRPNYPLGAWISQHRDAPERLTADQRSALEAMRMIWTPAHTAH